MRRSSLYLLAAVVLFCSLVAAVSADAGPDYREFNFLRFMAKRELTDAKCKGGSCENTTVVVAPGSARVIELTAPELSVFEVHLTATPAWRAPANMHTWATKPSQCNGMVAAAFRADHVPYGFTVSKAVGTHALLHQPVKTFVSSTDAAQQQLARCYNQSYGSKPPQGPPQSLDYNCTDYIVPHYSLLQYAESHPSAVLNWPNSSYPVPGPACETASSGTDCACYASTVQHNLQDESDVLHGAIPNRNGSTRHKECGVCGSRVYVYVYNCFTDHDAAMLVRVHLNKSADVPHDERCYTRRDQVAFDLLAVSLFFMAACVAAFLLPLGVSVVAAVLKECRTPAQSKETVDKGALARISASLQCKPATQTRTSRSWQLYKDILTTMHNPSGYSRLYTITLVTTAALLCASIVWPPTIRAEAQHDHAFYDSIIAPRQSTYAENKAHVITYYLKVMGLSALIGHTVKLALLANLSPPHPSSQGLKVPARVWRAQRWVSLLGLCVLTFLMGSSLFYMMLQWRVWSLIWPYWWLMACIMGNFLIALISFVWYTFIQPPPLSTPSMPDSNPAKPGPAAGPRPAPVNTDDQQATSPPPAPVTPAGFWPWGGASTALHAHPDQQRAGSSSGTAPKASPFEGHNSNDDVAARDCQGHSAPAVVPAPTAPATNREQRVATGAEVETKPGCLVATWRWLKSCPAWFKTAGLEEEDIKYSSWVLTPLWLTLYLIVFWWLMGVEVSGDLLDCLSDPVYCVSGGHVLGYGEPMMSPSNRTLMMKQVLDMASRQAMQKMLNSSLLDPSDQANLSEMVYDVTTLSNDMNFGTLNTLGSGKGLQAKHVKDAYEFYHENLDFARTVGRWVGYSVATAFALFSLFRIIMSFKRGITVSQQWEAYWREHPAEREVILQAGAEEHTTQARNLAHVMATMQGDPRQTIVWAQAITGMTVSAQAGGQGSYPRIGALRADMPTIMMPAGAGLPAPYPPAGSSTGGYPPMSQHAAIYPAMPSEPLPGLSATTSSGAAPPGASADGPGLSTRMMQRVQQHQEDMEKVGIGACVALFGVLISTMWIQIRFIGFILTMGFTIVAHPMFWSVAVDQGWIVAVVCLILLVVFNIVFVKMFVGSRVLSDGRNIKHPGTWMTYFLMFQLGFMVIGWLYSLWRILLALVVMLLYSVAALDRSLLHTAQFLDGPYKTFLASVKLEAAYRRISQGRPFPKNDSNSNKHPDKVQNRQHAQQPKDTQHQDDSDGNRGGTPVPSAPQLQQPPHLGPVGAISTQKRQSAPSNKPSSASSSSLAPSSQEQKPTQPGIPHMFANHQKQQQQQHAQPAVVDPHPPQYQPPYLGMQVGVVYPHVSNAPAAVVQDQVQVQVRTWDD